MSLLISLAMQSGTFPHYAIFMTFAGRFAYGKQGGLDCINFLLGGCFVWGLASYGGSKGYGMLRRRYCC